MDISGKLKEVKRWVKVWNKEVNGNINQRIEDLEKKQFQEDEMGTNEVLKLETHR